MIGAISGDAIGVSAPRGVRKGEDFPIFALIALGQGRGSLQGRQHLARSATVRWFRVSLCHFTQDLPGRSRVIALQKPGNIGLRDGERARMHFMSTCEILERIGGRRSRLSTTDKELRSGATGLPKRVFCGFPKPARAIPVSVFDALQQAPPLRVIKKGSNAFDP